MPAATTARPLHESWLFRMAAPELSMLENLAAEADWRPATVPGTVYQDLIAQGAIPDPYFGTQEAEVQWVAEQDWCYRCDFDVDAAALGAQVDLVLEGLDTFATVYLNGQRVLVSDNMFVPARIEVRGLLKPGTNRLGLYFESARRRGREREAALGRRNLWNGESSRLHVRKAQYHYGWDWGPVLLTAGPWQPVKLEAYETRLQEVDSTVHLATDLGHARVDLRCELAGTQDAALALHHRLLDPQGKLVAEASVPAGTEASLHVEAPELWWPNGQGAQPLYTLVTTLQAGEQVLDRHSRRIGLRRLRLVQEPVAGEKGSSFCFEVNGRQVFMGGANWIPDDNLLNRITPERYRLRVRQAAEANMNMLRVWGGGIYEDDAFYAACDELGLLVWQDFLFACGIYPANPEFLRSVEAEAAAAVKRLRHHACLALWCGNNEDYAIAESMGLYGKGKDMVRFEARAIYEQLLPELCARLDPQRPYWPGSPYSPSANDTLSSDNPTVGDRHSWEIWHGAMLPYQRYHTVQARFVSEFGMQSHPSLDLLQQAIPEAEQFPLSRTMAAHNKAGLPLQDGHRRLAVYVADTLNAGPTLADAVYATQFVQAEAMRYAFQDFRHRWLGAGRRAVGGALVWQLNDCWPVTSWAIIDSLGTLKPAWHAIRRALAPLAIAVRQVDGEARCWISSALAATRCEVRLQCHALAGVSSEVQTAELMAPSNGSADLNFPLDLAAPAVVEASLWVDGECIARDCAWPEPFRFHPLGDCGLQVARHAGGLTLRTERPAKGIWLAAPGVNFSDNFIDLMPGDVRSIAVTGPDLPIQVTALDQTPFEA